MFKVMILEVGYASDWRWERRVEDKNLKYAPLAKAIADMGWEVEYKSLVVGALGCVYEHGLQVTEWLGIKGKRAGKGVMREIAQYTAKATASILGNFDRLELEMDRPKVDVIK